jgi:hypothetical protein
MLKKVVVQLKIKILSWVFVVFLVADLPAGDRLAKSSRNSG